MTAQQHHEVPPPAEPPWDPDYDAPPAANSYPPPAAAHSNPVTDAERAVLGHLITTPDLAPRLAPELDGTDFDQPSHELLWNTIHTLTEQGTTPDHLAVVTHLTRTGQLRQAGGDAYLLQLREAVHLVADPTTACATVRDAARLRTIGTLGTKFRQIADTGTPEQVDDALAHAVDTLDQAATRFGPRTPTRDSTWAPVDLERVLAGDMLDPPPTILTRTDGQPLLYDGGVHTIAGESESGKTWLTLIAALQLLEHGDNVVFLDFEDRADRVIGRLLALGATPAQIRDHFAYIRPDRPLDNDGRHALTPALHDVRLVIIDGVTEAMTLHGLELLGNSDAASFYELLPRWIADHGPAVVMIDHVVKDKERQDRFALGAQHKLAGVDGASYIVKMLQPFARGKRGLARVEIAKDRPGHVREHAFGKTIAEFTLDATRSDTVLIAHLMPPGEESGRRGETFEPTHLMEKISRAVQLTPGLSKKAIEDLVNGKATTKRLALELLVTRGYINAKTESRGRIAHYHLKPYYADGDPDETDDSDAELEAS